MYGNTPEEFQNIILGCRKQNRDSQNLLYRLYYSYGMSVGIRYVNSESEAITILNDAYLKVFKYMKKFDIDQPFKPWFRRIVVNTALTYIKKQKKFKLEVNMEDARNVSTNEDVFSKIGYQELMSMVQSLSLAYRTVFNLYVIDGFKHHEIADKLGITVSTSKSNLSRARVKLQELVIAKIK